MEEQSEQTAALLQALLERCDLQYQEIQRLKGRLSEGVNVDVLKSSYEHTIATQKDKILSLEKQVAYLNRRIWGHSSERFIKEDPLQRKLDFEGLELLPEEEEQARQAETEIQEHKARVIICREKRKPVRKPLSDTLPRVEEHIYPQDIHPSTCTELAPEITEVLEFEPGKCFVRRIIRHKYVLKNNEVQGENSIITPQLPPLPLAKSYAGASLLAELIIGKYVDHLPFYRQIGMFGRLGVTLPAATINDWFKGTADLLRPLYYRLKDLILESDYIQVDESTLPVVSEEKHKTVKGYIWLVRSVMRDLVFFHYDQGSRAQKVVIPLLKNFRGALQTDGYEVYKMYEYKQGVLPLGCWAHARRKFDESLKEDKSRAEYALGQIGMLYDVERRADREELSFKQRAELRTRLSYPLMVAFEKWLAGEYPKVLPKSRIGKAIKYTYEIYHRLTRYHLDGRYKIDNLAENSIRPLALGRKNYLFCGNHDAAEDAAVIYSLLGCCKAAKVDYRQWLVYVLGNIHDYDRDYNKDLAELLPHNWKDKSL
jgi:transposase